MPELSVTLFLAVCLTLCCSTPRCTSKVRGMHREEEKDRERRREGITLHANAAFSVAVALGLTEFRAIVSTDIFTNIIIKN